MLKCLESNIEERGEVAKEMQHGKYPSGRPFVMNEYCHAMGNSLGNFKDYWDFIYKHEMFAGGFVWDWIDQALWKEPGKPETGFVYGGDFGDVPNNGNFCVNGLIAADLIPHPHYEELKKVYQPVALKFIAGQPLTIEIENHNLYLNTNRYNFSYRIFEDGILTKEELLPDVDCKSGEKTQITIDNVSFNKTKEVFITLLFSLKDNRLWADKDHVVAWEQFKLNDATEDNYTQTASRHGDIYLKESESEYSISGDDFTAVVDKSTGLLSGFRYNEKEIIVEDMRFNFWRALTDNDLGWRVNRIMGVWKNEGSDYTVTNIKAGRITDKEIVVESKYVFNNTRTTANVKHTFYSDGRIRFDVDINIPKNARILPRIGLQFVLNKNMSNVEWYGRGPHENYIDRKTSAAVGIYRSTVNDWVTPYVRPQENGNRSDVRWVTFDDGDEDKCEFAAGSGNLLSVSAWPYRQETLEKAAHDFELKSCGCIVVNVDYKQMGVGGDNSWRLPVHRQYLIHPGNYSYSFILRPSAGVK